MSSIFNWLCFPNRHTRSKKKWLRNPDDDQAFASVKKQKRKLNNRIPQQADYIRKQPSFSDRERSLPYTNEQKSVDSSIPNKRRRVQDIFNLQNSEHSEITPSHNFEKGYRRNNRTITDFGSEYTPKMYTHAYTPHGNRTESMYGYVPKVVQTCSASNALEGNRGDDFFSHFHRENSLHRFGKMNLKNRTNFNPLVSTFTNSQSQTSSSAADKVSLIESEEVSHVEDTGMKGNGLYCDMSSRVNSILDASFDSMWNSNGEVLY